MTPKRLILTGLCLALLALAGICVHRASGQEGNALGVVGYGFLAAALLIPAGILFALAYLEAFTFPFTRIIDEVFGLVPDKRKPPLDLAIADRLEQHEGPEAAEREYLRLLDYYPRSLEVWMRLIALRSETYGIEAARSTLREARDALKRNPEARRILERMEVQTRRAALEAGAE